MYPRIFETDMILKKIATCAFLIFLVFSVDAQKKIQSPDEFLPFKLGEHFTPHHLLVSYFQEVAANSNQMILKEYGRTNEMRPLIYAIISSPENIKNIEAIRLNNLKRTGLLEGTIDDGEKKAIIWLSYNVHGNEAGAAESSMPTLYDLVDTKNKNVQEWLKNTIVILDPCINPDGYSRYSHWNWQVGNKSPNPDPISIEHEEPWPGGRVNHYLFDLNRDWAWQTQVETQQRLKIYHEWMPHIHVDYHEQGENDPYYFAPAAQPYHEYITDWQGDFQHSIGKNNAQRFDQEGWLYFTKEIFDLFYPSYGDTYPMFNGAIGMTYEQAGHGDAGRAILLDNGDTLTLMDRIDHHHATALSTIEVSSKNADQLVDEFGKYFQSMSDQPMGEYKTFVIEGENQTAKIKQLIQLLDQHQIKYGRAKNVNKSLEGFNYINGENTTVKIEEEDLIINAYQPKSVLVQVLFEPEPYLVDSLTYDITAWALPYAYGLEAFALKEKVNINQPFQLKEYQAKKIKELKSYAYLATWEGVSDARFLKSLLEQNVQVRVASEAFEKEGQFYGVGTLVINQGDNRKLGKDFDQIVRTTAKKWKKNISGQQGGYASRGADLGSEKMKLLKQPKILLLTGEETSVNEYGQVWYFFDQVLGQEVTTLKMESLSEINLGDYNLLVMPDGNYDEMELSTFHQIKGWIEKGNKLIAMGNAINFFKNKKDFGLGIEPVNAENTNLKAPLEVYADQERESISSAMPGAIYKLRFDNTHPLGYGFSNYYFSLKTSKTKYPYLKEGWNVGYIDEQPYSIGFVGANLKKKMKETTVFGVQEIKKGNIIYMVDNPLFRGFWEQGNFLFCNAVYLVN